MKKKWLFSAIAVSVIASAANAGIINPSVNGVPITTTNEINVSSQWIQKNKLTGGLSDVNVSLNEVYEPTDIKLASMKNPVLSIKYSNTKNITTNLSNTYVCEVNTSGYPLAKPALLQYNTNNGIDTITYIATNANVYLDNGHYYRIFKDVNESNCSEAADGTPINAANISNYLVNTSGVQITMADAKPVNATFTLGTGDSQQVQDTAVESNVVNVGNQFTAIVSPKFDNKIDPNSGFIAFNTTQNSCQTTYATSDSVEIDLLSNECQKLNPLYEVATADAIYAINSNMPLPLASKDGVKFSVQPKNDKYTLSDDNSTLSFTNTYNGLDGVDVNKSQTVTFTLDGIHQIPTASFTATLKIDLNQDGTPDVTLLDKADAGQWTYNGTTLTTPYVAVNGDTQTVIRINNGSNLKAQVYWTCTDDNGVTVQNIQAPSAIYKLDYIKPNGADAWLMSTVLKAAQAKNPDFAPDGKMRCKALVTSTKGVSGIEIMTINGARDRVIPLD